ncbi:MAG: DUF4405 domain-containing protein [Gordonibacter sp.]|nr:DUF4405 domain-containing protein [Gordonibacter sp.]
MKWMLLIDVVAFVVYTAVTLPAFTGIPLHEWLSMVLLLPMLIHGALHIDWVIVTLRQLGRGVALARIGKLALDAALLVVFMVVVVSGLGISGTVLQTFGLYAEGYYVWAPLHAIAAKVLFALLLVHVAAHARSLYNLLKRSSALKCATQDDRSLDNGRRPT